MDSTCSVCGLPKELCVCTDIEKTSSTIDIRFERRKYGKLWCIVSGVDVSAQELKPIVKAIKNKMACAGTIKGTNIEVLYGRNDRTKELIEVLVSLGFDRDSIRVSGK